MSRLAYGVKLQIEDIAKPFGEQDEVVSRLQLLLEQLRYMGVLCYQGDHEFTVWAPTEMNGPAWQEMNLARLRSFGLTGKAVHETKN